MQIKNWTQALAETAPTRAPRTKNKMVLRLRREVKMNVLGPRVLPSYPTCHTPPPPATYARHLSLPDMRADLLLASLDAARWDLAGTNKNAKRRLREAARIADGVREELSSVEGKMRGGHVCVCVCVSFCAREALRCWCGVVSSCDVLSDVLCDLLRDLWLSLLAWKRRVSLFRAALCTPAFGRRAFASMSCVCLVAFPLPYPILSDTYRVLSGGAKSVEGCS